jgi:kinesin family protein 5
MLISSQSDSAQGAFTFDRVFGMNSRQHEIFDYSIKSTVDDIMDGYNGTVFAYGQTGAGKSYSMMGGSIDDAEQKGIIPRITEQIFTAIQHGSDSVDWLLRVSYMEIYMEQIRDLLKPTSSNLPIHEEKGKGVYVKGLSELYVQSAEEVYEIMRVGGDARKVASTNMNQESSRSHSIFVINVEQENRETKSKKSGTLFLVDLAGSEKVGKTGASGQTLEEAKKINKSLSALGMVINALTDGKSSHVPYRDSKLTRILQESLGGNSRTTLIICCSPSSYNDQETLSTLRFGTRAKAIKNKAKVNAEISPAELKAIIKKYELQSTNMAKWIALANPELIRWHGGDQVAKEDWTPNWAAGDATLKKLTEKAAPATPTRLQNEARAETPTSRPDSRMDIERAGTPSVLEKDEREEFLRRENELQDQLAERENSLSIAQKGFKEVKDELASLRDHDSRMSGENQKMSSEIHDLQMQLDRIKFDMKEEVISMDSLKEANTELTAELDEIKQQLLDARTAARENGTGLDEKERLKRERMATMMAGFDLGGELFSDNERSIRKTIEQIDALQEGGDIAPDDLRELRRKLLETQGIVRQAEASVTQKAEQEEAALLRREALEKQLSKVQAEYEAFLEGKLSAEDAASIKARLADSLTSRQASEAEHLSELSEDVARKTEQNKKLAQEIEILQQRLKGGVATNGVAANGTVGGKTVQQQFAEFEVMKKSLMRDLQNRCERVYYHRFLLQITCAC